MGNKKILLLLNGGMSSNVIFNVLNEKFNISKVIIESKESKSAYIKRRMKKLGVTIVLSQLLFKIMIVPALKYFSKKRINAGSRMRLVMALP